MMCFVRALRRAASLVALASMFGACSTPSQTSRPSQTATETPDAVSGGAVAAGSQPALRIEALGDSITEVTCQTQLLERALHERSHREFDLVGTVTNKQQCGVSAPDRDCEGHSGYRVTQIVGSGSDASQLPIWCERDRADVVLMHFGTNDIWHDHLAPTPILNAYSLVVAALRAVQPRVVIFVAQIIPASASDCPDCGNAIQALNRAIPAWAATQTSATSPIYVVDQWTGFDPSGDTSDGVHPNLSGSQKMADTWTAALLQHGVL
ncbi:MAG TPA: SGNH/GDSL hydrolase family protein [Polyangiales bacterium]|nr:SGNH/GDSL hydrolase family protein [Polyangiales bacterium]